MSFQFFVLSSITLVLYYAIPLICGGVKAKKMIQRGVLLAASMAFYYLAADLRGMILFLLTMIAGYFFGMALDRAHQRAEGGAGGRLLFILAVALCASPLLLIKLTPWFPALDGSIRKHIIIPLGISFYTLQMIAYLSDCYSGKIRAERRFPSYALFISFFPHIVQGPIPRYAALSKQFRKYHRFDIRNMTRGLQRVIWGCFLKMMIADRVAPVVNLVFDHADRYAGAYVLVAALFYSIQLYTDFYSCVTICQGVAELFGIALEDNFQRPYFATSIKDFWRRWHISLSSWFRDYVYIPLGGSRRGVVRTYLNVIIVFLLSGLWHGEGTTFIVWGLLHGLYQVVGKLTLPLRERVYAILKFDARTMGYRLLKRAGTVLWVTIGWVFFRAADLKTALTMFRNLFADFNPWILFGKERFTYGLDENNWPILLCALAVLVVVSACQERGVKIRDAFERQPFVVRWMVYIVSICVIWIFGIYGTGFNAADFIYGGF